MLWKNNFWERVSTNSRRGSLRRQIDDTGMPPGYLRGSQCKTGVVLGLEFGDTKERSAAVPPRSARPTRSVSQISAE